MLSSVIGLLALPQVMAEDCGDLAATFNIQAMPAVLVFTQGKVICLSS